MEFENPLLRGLYPDPSVCCVDGMYYLVNSTFEYVPGIPIHRSRDLVNWEQIGHVLTRKSQLDLTGARASDGVFAPTIRYHDGLFYVVVTVALPGLFKNFFVTAKDPTGPWSDPVYVDAIGIDPSLFWEDGRTYFQYAGRGEIFQAEIDGKTGEIIDGPRVITCGCGGRDAEGPHMWVRDGWHYLLLAEGGTREGHMVTLMRGKSVWGPFEPSPHGPVTTNRELPREPIQRTGHSDWAVGPDGKDYLVALGVREVRAHRSLLGRETVLAPVEWTPDGWLRASGDGRLPTSFAQSLGEPRACWDFTLSMDGEGERHTMPMRVISPRADNSDHYSFEGGELVASGNGRGLDDGDSCFWAVRQPEKAVDVRTVLTQIHCDGEKDEVGLTALITNSYHLSLFATVRDGEHVFVVRRRVGDIADERCFPGGKPGEPVELRMVCDGEKYRFYVGGELLCDSLASHVTCEVAGTQNTGVVDGIFVSGNASASFSTFELRAGGEAR